MLDLRLIIPNRRTIAQFGVRDTDRNENHEVNDLGQPATITETSHSIAGSNEKQGAGLPFELADNELDPFPVELPAFYAGPAINDTLVEANEGSTEDVDRLSRSGTRKATTHISPPPKSVKRKSVPHFSSSYSSQSRGGPADGKARSPIVDEKKDSRPRSDEYSYPTEAIMHMNMNDGEATPYSSAFGTAI
jgi:hypothetical protein